jgi:hypothetical protein
VVTIDPYILFPNRWQTHGPFEKKGDHAERAASCSNALTILVFRRLHNDAIDWSPVGESPEAAAPAGSDRTLVRLAGHLATEPDRRSA